MVVIRLRRAGSKKRPFFRVVVTDSRAARDSSFVEILGHYNPRTKPAIVNVDKDRVSYWLSKGAQPSDSVRTLIARHLTPMPQAPQAPGDTQRGLFERSWKCSREHGPIDQTRCSSSSRSTAEPRSSSCTSRRVSLDG